MRHVIKQKDQQIQVLKVKEELVARMTPRDKRLKDFTVPSNKNNLLSSINNVTSRQEVSTDLALADLFARSPPFRTSTGWRNVRRTTT